MGTLARTELFDRARLLRAADGLMIAVAVSLPWSTSATGILLVVWLLAVLPTITLGEFRREISAAPGGLPVLLFLLGAIGTLWADVTWLERWHGLDSFFKLLVIPILLVQFRRSDRGLWVFGAYLAACIALLALSMAIAAWPSLWRVPEHFAVPVKNAPAQSGEFATCIAVLFYLAFDFIKQGRWKLAAGSLLVIAGMLANIFYIATSRTALVVLLILVMIWGFKEFGTRGKVGVVCAVLALCAAAWLSSPYFRARTVQLWTDYQKYEATDERNSSGERIEFWKKSAEFVGEAPIFGHGTGSIHALFIRSSAGQSGAAASATTNPHNQTFAVAIQIGLLGAAMLWAMWVAHLLLFRGGGLVSWIGLVVVIQNIIGSLFNSHLFDFTQGWVYVVGVGVAGGMVLRRRTAVPAATVRPA
jgi:O-antigen ligase